MKSDKLDKRWYLGFENLDEVDFFGFFVCRQNLGQLRN